MLAVWTYSLLSVLLISLVSFVGVLTIPISTKKLKRWLIYMVSFSAGALFGDVFFHLLPEIIGTNGLSFRIALGVMAGIVFSFIIEKVIHWRHCHFVSKDHTHPFATMNLFGDAIHNFIDGLIIAGSYLVSTAVGVATTIAVLAHELPQEIGDFGVLLHGGYSKSRALLMNFLTALTAIVGAVVALLLSDSIPQISLYIIPFAVGGFLYIAGSDLIPELHKEVKPGKSLMQLFAFIIGIGLMIGLLKLEF